MFFFFLMIRRPPRSTLFPTRRSSDLVLTATAESLTEVELNRARAQVEAGLLMGLETAQGRADQMARSEEHTSELQSRRDLVCRLLLEKKKKIKYTQRTKHKKAKKTTI